MSIASVAPVGALSLIIGGRASTCLLSKLVITQFLFHFNSKDTSQLINGMFNALQKLPKYFNGIAYSIFRVPFFSFQHLLLHYMYCLLFYFYT